MVQPSGSDRRGRGQDLLTLDVLCTLQRLRSGPCADLRGSHLREAGQVRVAQHQADIGMRNQPPVRVDDIGMTALADLDLGDHVPDQLEIDFGDADPSVLARAGQRQCHIGLGLSRRKYTGP